MIRGKTVSLHRFGFGFAILFGISLFALSRSTLFTQNPDALAFGIALDLTLTIPLLYFLLIRKTNVPNHTVGSVIVAGVLMAGWILPTENQSFLPHIKKFGLPFLEIGILGLIGWKIRHTYHQYQAQRGKTQDFYEIVKESLGAFPKKIRPILATEIAVIYFNLFGWRKRPLRKGEFSYHKKNGIIIMTGVLLFLVLMETFALHLLLVQWSHTLAWLLTLLSVYTFFQITGFLWSLKHRPIFVDPEKRELHLKYGFFAEASIPIDNIDKIEKSRRTMQDDDFCQFSPLELLDTHNLIVYVKQSAEMQGIYGITRTFKMLAIHVDQRDAFLTEVQKLMRP